MSVQNAPCTHEPAPAASLVARGVSRMLHDAGYASLTELPLGNGRRADVAGLNGRGELVIVEVKVSRADLLGDQKWPEYMDYCDRFYFAVPDGFDLDLFDRPAFQSARCGLMVSDGFQCSVVRESQPQRLSGARRKAETLRFAQRAALRLMAMNDPAFQPGSALL